MWLRDDGQIGISANDRGATVKVIHQDGSYNIYKFVVIAGKLTPFWTEQEYEDWKASCEYKSGS